jgi:CRISPR/Cas system-associated exonuclease Cas4 (RecB family)
MSLPTRLPVPFSFSQSSLQDFIECERQFYLHFIEQLAWPAVESEPVLENERRRLEGELFHRLIQQFWLGLPSDKLATIAKTANLDEWWKNFLNYDFDLAGVTTYPELNLSMQLGNHRLKAKYDLVAVSNNRTTIIDWKTFKKRPREERLAASYQTRVYCYLMVKAGGFLNPEFSTIQPDQIEMVYWLANFPDQPIRLPYSSRQFDHDDQQLSQVIAQIEAEDNFPLTPDERKCNYCVYRSYCDRGISAFILDEEQEPGEDVAALDLDQVAEIEY